MFTTNKPLILLIDDNHMDVCKTQRLLCKHYRVITSFDGHNGYQQAIASKPCLILLDVRMPRMNGYNVCSLLKCNPLTQAIPVIFVSAASSVEERVEGLTIGGVDYISKPFFADELLARVRIHLELERKIQISTTSDTDSCNSSPESVMVMAVKQLIHADLKLNLSLAEIAYAVGCYEKKLSSIFQTYTGLTVFAYIREERIRTAREILAKTNMSMLEIADEIGFQNAASFATAFRAHMGVTPSAYRQFVRKSALSDAKHLIKNANSFRFPDD